MTHRQITTIDLIRHGQPEGGRRYRGQIDDPLSKVGWVEMREAVGDHCPWELVVTSPLSRCVAFADELASRHDLPLMVEPRFKEIGFGAWEGMTPEELTLDDPLRLMRFQQAPSAHLPPGAEPIEAFSERVATAWAAITRRHAGTHLLMVVHAGVIRMVLREVLTLPLDAVFRIEVPYAALTRVRIEQQGEYILPKLVFHAIEFLEGRYLPPLPLPRG